MFHIAQMLIGKIAVITEFLLPVRTVSAKSSRKVLCATAVGSHGVSSLQVGMLTLVLLVF